MSLKGKRIFFVEDNVANKTIMLMILEMAGAIVGFERSSAYAVERLKLFGKPAPILLDLMLPHQSSGFDLFSAIRSLPHYSKVPIVAVSATNPSEAIPRAKLMGFAGFMSKPLDQALLPLQLQGILDGETVWINGSIEVQA